MKHLINLPQRLGLFILMLMSTSLLHAYSFCVDGIYYNTNGSEATVTYKNTSYNSYSGEVVIPASVTYSGTTYSVTSIGYGAFYECSGLTSVTIPNSVTSIGEHAFRGCSGLTEVTIPNSVTSIGFAAFYDCSGLTEVTIPDSVTSIGEYAFRECSGLTSVTIPNSVTSIGAEAFRGCSGLTKVSISDLSAWCRIRLGSEDANPLYYAKHLYLNDSEITNLVIPEDVKSIGDMAFYGCSGLTEVTIPNSVTFIYGYAFSGCSGLTEVTIPNSVTSIGYYAFRGCSGLTEVTIPNSVTSIGNGAFADCTDMTTLYYNATNCTSCGSEDHPAFPSTLNEVIIGNNVKTIPAYTFYICDDIKHIYSYALTPPTLQINSFSEYYDYSATLYVPEAALEAYKSADGWKNFLEINAAGIEDVTVDGGAEVAVNGNLLTITGSGQCQVVTLSGVVSYSGDANCELSLTPGIYVVVINGKAQKIAIR